MRKFKDIKLVTTERRRNYLVSEPNYHTTNFFTENILAIEMKKTEILMNKHVCLGLSILEFSKILLNEFWYDYVKPIYCEKATLYYMGTGSFTVSIITDDIYKDTAEDVETRYNTLNYELDRALPKGRNKKVIGLMKGELDGKIMAKFVGLRAKTDSYLVDDVSEDKKAKNTKKCFIKRKLKLKNYKKCFKATQSDKKINYLRKK